MNFKTTTLYLENLHKTLEQNYNLDLNLLRDRLLSNLKILCEFLQSVSVNNKNLQDINISSFKILSDYTSSYKEGKLDTTIPLDKFYEKVNLFIIEFSKEICLLSITWLTDSVDKLKLIRDINLENTQKHLKLAESIYINKNEQDDLNKKAQKSEITTKLEAMKNDASCKVTKHTRVIFVLFLLLLITPWILNQANIKVILDQLDINYIIYFLVYIPIISFIWYFIQQRSYAVKIATDYEFKLNAFTLFLYSHNWVNEKITSKDTQEKTYAKLVENLLSTLADNPTRLYEKEVKGLPANEVINLIKEMIRKEKQNDH